MEVANNNKLPFIGMELTKIGKRLETCVYRKTTNKGLLLHYQSGGSKTQVTGQVRSQVRSQVTGQVTGQVTRKNIFLPRKLTIFWGIQKFGFIKGVDNVN